MRSAEIHIGIKIFAITIFVIALPTLIKAQDTTDGIVWEPPIQLTDTSYSAYMPKIALSGDDTIHVTWWGGLKIPYASSTDGGCSWNVKDLILDTITYAKRFSSNLITSQDNRVYMISAGEPTSVASKPREIRIHKSSDGGISWSSPIIVGKDSVAGLNSANMNGDTLVIVYAPMVNGYVKREMMIVSTDAGETWEKRPDTLDGWTRIALTPGTLHLVRDVFTNGAQEKLYMRSFDLGNTWFDKETLSTVDGKWSYEHAMASNNANADSAQIMVAWRDGLACAGMVGCTIIERESRTNGEQWLSQEILTEQPRGSVPSIALDAKNMAAISWKDEIDQLDIKRLFVRVRKDPDSTWCLPIDVTQGSYVTGMNDIALSSNAIHVVYNNTVGNSFCVFYRRGIFLTTGIKEDNNEIPEGFSLSQNYPNPFNPSTKLSFDISHSSFVSMKVYDVFGREVATLVNEIKQPGKYTVTWDASSLASGVYFYSLISQDSRYKIYTETKKAILIK
ncbi:MAG: T9SS type A sorting domain-containing protein [Ignavibacteriales bacterium]|nr:T9SS type A sorting domain-containing protein [Ignavibacteriales bacterium]